MVADVDVEPYTYQAVSLCILCTVCLWVYGLDTSHFEEFMWNSLGSVHRTQSLNLKLLANTQGCYRTPQSALRMYPKYISHQAEIFNPTDKIHTSV